MRLRARPRHDVSGLLGTMALADPTLTGLGFGPGRIATIETDDPDLLLEALRTIPSMPPAPRPASFRPVGGKKGLLRFALGELDRAASEPVGVIALPKGAPFGAVEIEGNYSMPFLRVGMPNRCIARPPPMPISKMPTFSADCALQPAPSTSSR